MFHFSGHAENKNQMIRINAKTRNMLIPNFMVHKKNNISQHEIHMKMLELLSNKC